MKAGIGRIKMYQRREAIYNSVSTVELHLSGQSSQQGHTMSPLKNIGIYITMFCRHMTMDAVNQSTKSYEISISIQRSLRCPSHCETLCRRCDVHIPSARSLPLRKLCYPSLLGFSDRKYMDKKGVIILLIMYILVKR